METKNPGKLEPTRNTTAENPDMNDAIRNYVRAYALWHGRPQAARHFGVSCHTLGRFMEWGHLGRSLPKAVGNTVGDEPSRHYGGMGRDRQPPDTAACRRLQATGQDPGGHPALVVRHVGTDSCPLTVAVSDCYA